MAKDKKLPNEENINHAETAPESVNDENWLDNILGTSTPSAELGVDELAVTAAGLTHPDDLELEKILAEDWDSVPDEGAEEVEQTSFLEQTQYFAPVTEEDLQQEVAQQEILEPEEEPQVQEEELPVEKEKPFMRPKKKGSYGFFGLPHVLSTFAWLLIIVIVN